MRRASAGRRRDLSAYDASSPGFVLKRRKEFGMIYLDHAATSCPKPQPVVDAVIDAMQHLGNADRGSHSGTLGASRLLYRARQDCARFFGLSHPSRVIFTGNVTEALNIALFGLLHEGDHVISTDQEHNSMLRPLYTLQKERGVRLDFLPADGSGKLMLSRLESLLQPNTRLLAVNHSSNVTGRIAPLPELLAFKKKHRLLLLLDTAQTAGVLPLNMEQSGIDVLCFTGHKSLFGPTGTGGLLLRSPLLLDKYKYGGSGIQSFYESQPEEYPTRLEAGTLNVHGIAGLLAAIHYVEKIGLAQIQAREQALLRRFLLGIRHIPDIRIYGWDLTETEGASAELSGLKCHTPVVSLLLKGYDSGELSDILSTDYGIATRPGAHCAPRIHRALGTAESGLCRFSFSYHTTEEEVDAAIHALRDIASSS